MRKWKILLPSLIATASMPLVGLVGCNKDRQRYADQYLTFTALNDGYFECDIGRIDYSKDIPLDLWYSINGGRWNKVEHNYRDESTFDNKYNYHKNDVIRFKGGNEYFSHESDIDNERWWTSLHFSGLGNISGNAMALLYGDNFRGKTDLKCDGVFDELFDNDNNSTGLDFAQFLNANNLILPSTKLRTDCYQYMFYNCKNIITPPKLLATSLADYCYDEMFRYCSSLQYAPRLTAPLCKDCYWGMFMDCTSLKVEEHGDNDHFIFTCPKYIPNDAVGHMFSDTGGTIQGTPEAGKTYYWA